MSNEYYTHTGYPANSQEGLAASERAELLVLQSAFDKMPALSANQRKLIEVNASANGLTINDSRNILLTTWVPVLTCATPGNLAISYTTQIAYRLGFGPIEILNFEIVTSSFTHTTASGAVFITGWLGSYSDLVPAPISTLLFSGITKANYTQFALDFTPNGAVAFLRASGSAQAQADVAITDLPTGGTVKLKGTIVIGGKRLS
jgi:hypothetical protein